jgi:hypothetical protein
MIIQATKVWWDGEKLMTETIDPASIYKDKAQDSTCNNALRLQGKAYPRTCAKCGFGPCVANSVKPAQRPWVDLSFDELPQEEFGNVEFLAGARWAARKLKERNT